MSDAPRQPAVVDGRLVYTSASAINRHTDCNRSWWFRYVMGLKDPPGPAAIAGTEAHARLTEYINKGIDILTPLERLALPYLSERGPHLRSEVSVEGVLDGAHVPFKGGMDVLDTSNATLPVVTDFKFKGKPGVDRALLTDPRSPEGRQMLAYAETARRLLPDAEQISVRHLHFKTKGRPAIQEFQADPLGVDSVKSLWHLVCSEYVEPIVETAKATKPDDVTPNRGFCYAYHKPCPFMAQCPTGSVSFASLFNLEEKQVGLLDQLNKAKSAAVVEQSVVQQPAKTVQATSVAETVLPAFTIGARYTMSDGSVGELKELNGPIGRFIVNPGSATASWRDSALTTVGETIATPAPAPAVTDATPAPVVEGGSPGPVTTSAEAPKKRGRPAKKAEPVEAPAPIAYRYDPTDEADIETKIKAAVIREAAAIGTRLYIGCSPIGVQTQTLHAYLDETEKSILKTLDETLPDIRLAGHEMLQFGKWKAVLAQSVIKSPPPPGHYVVPGIPGEKLQVVVDALAGILAATPGALVIC